MEKGEKMKVGGRKGSEIREQQASYSLSGINSAYFNKPKKSN
jgi:hypothetical protein